MTRSKVAISENKLGRRAIVKKCIKNMHAKNAFLNLQVHDTKWKLDSQTDKPYFPLAFRKLKTFL